MPDSSKDIAGSELESVKAIGKLDMLNQLFREDGVKFYTIDDGDGFLMSIGNTRYFFNPVIDTDTYKSLDGKTHTRKYLKYDGWEKSL